LVEPLAVAWHAVKVSPFQKGDTALVIGAGPVGLALITVLKAQGAGKILVSEVSKLRKELSQVFGAVVVDPAEGDVRAKILEHSDDVGPSVVFDAAGVQTGLDLAMSVCRTGGTIVNLAIWKTKKPQIDDVALVMGEKKYVGSMGYLAEDFKQVIEAIGRGKAQSNHS
jgi:threonine dehydrogenase-like Zn-dependent dehydrogenase